MNHLRRLRDWWCSGPLIWLECKLCTWHLMRGPGGAYETRHGWRWPREEGGWKLVSSSWTRRGARESMFAEIHYEDLMKRLGPEGRAQLTRMLAPTPNPGDHPCRPKRPPPSTSPGG